MQDYRGIGQGNLSNVVSTWHQYDLTPSDFFFYIFTNFCSTGLKFTSQHYVAYWCIGVQLFGGNKHRLSPVT